MMPHRVGAAVSCPAPIAWSAYDGAADASPAERSSIPLQKKRSLAMKINMVILWAVVSMAGLAACSKNAPPADGLPVAAPNAVAAPTSTTPAADPRTTGGSVFDRREGLSSGPLFNRRKWPTFRPALTVVPLRRGSRAAEGFLYTRIVDGLIEDPRRSSADDLGGLFSWLNRAGPRPQGGLYADTRHVDVGQRTAENSAARERRRRSSNRSLIRNAAGGYPVDSK